MFNFYKKKEYFFKYILYFLLCFSIFSVLDFIFKPYKIMGIDKFYGFLLVYLYSECFKKAYNYLLLEIKKNKKGL